MHELYEHFKKNKPSCFKSQYGFQSNHSIEYAASEIVGRFTRKTDKIHVPINI